MLDSWKDQAVLRIWALPQAPPEFQRALSLEKSEPDSWVAHIPRGLVDEPLVALLGFEAALSGGVETILLADGSRLLSGASSRCGGPGDGNAVRQFVCAESVRNHHAEPQPVFTTS